MMDSEPVIVYNEKKYVRERDRELHLPPLSLRSLLSEENTTVSHTHMNLLQFLINLPLHYTSTGFQLEGILIELKLQTMAQQSPRYKSNASTINNATQNENSMKFLRF